MIKEVEFWSVILEIVLMYNEGFCKKNINFWGPCDVKKTFFIPRVPYSVLGFYFMHNIWHNAGIWTRVAATGFLNRKLFCVCDACARPNSQFFWNWIPKNIPDRQKCVAFRKLQKSAYSLNPTERYTWTVEWSDLSLFCDFQQKIGNIRRGKVFIFLIIGTLRLIYNIEDLQISCFYWKEQVPKGKIKN